MVDVGGKTMTLHCYGSGNPVVVLESGLGAGWNNWANIIDRIKEEVRVCAYERSYLSKSSQQFVEDLHILLANAGLKGPFILVGHSYGGMNVILYAHQYPQEVAGIVLEDILEPGYAARFLAALPPETPNDSPDLKELRRGRSTPRRNARGVDITASSEQSQAVQSLGDIPLIVLTALTPFPEWGDIPDQVKATLDETRQAMQKELTRLSTNSKQIMSSTNEHAIHLFVPQEVVDAIMELVQMRRGQ